MKRFFTYFFIFLFLNVHVLFGQAPNAAPHDTAEVKLSTTSYRTKNIEINKSDTIRLDSLSIESGSFKIIGVSVEDYKIDYVNSVLQWIHKPQIDSVKISYRVLPISFSKRYYHKSGEVVSNAVAMGEPTSFKYSGDSAFNNNFADFKSLDYSGSYSRSLSVGNTSSSGLNSQFNLQMNGYILDSVRVEGAISDNNIPFQPDGNTQRLQQFDQIYLTFQKNEHKLTAGDYNLIKPQSYFLNFNKRVQGLMYEGTVWQKGDKRNRIGISASIAKGQYARDIFFGQEGNQGPYILTDNDGQQVYVIIAGTEKVYIDGILLKRGADNDYIINYNTGELTFMPAQIVNKDKRIQVEFEYQDNNYLNTLVYLYDDLQLGKKLNLHFNFYSNQDSKNQPYSQTLNADTKSYLATIGDSINQAYVSGVQRDDTFSANKIMYRLTDSLVNGTHYDSVFVYTTDSTQTLYTLSFSNVGAGKGNYEISGETTNGRSYQWVAPLNGLPQGSYAPVALIITPKMQQVATLNATYQIDSNKKIYMEVAASNYDPNLFSKIDNNHHIGYASHLEYNETRYFKTNDSTKKSDFVWQNKAYFEQVKNNFKAINAYRNIEFSRDWNSDSSKQNELLTGIASKMIYKNATSLEYDFDYYKRGIYYSGNRNIVTAAFIKNGWNVKGIINLVNTSSDFMKTTYFRPSLVVERTFHKLNDLLIGASYAKEYDKQIGNDTFLYSSFNYDISKIYLSNKISDALHYELSYMLRRDQMPVYDHWESQNNSQTLEGKLTMTKWAHHQLSFTGGFRKLTILNTKYTAYTPSDNMVARVEYVGNVKNSFITTNVLYEVGNGQEQKTEFTYVEVTAGQGMYMWIDYNNDGIQQSTEFVLATYPDQKKYIRVTTVTSDYVRVNYMNLNLSLNINPAVLWKKEGRKSFGSKFASLFSDQFMVQLNNKALKETGWKVYNPFNKNFGDTTTVSGSTVLSNTFYFNRNSVKWGADFNSIYTGTQSLLTYGLESSGNLKHTLKLRYVPSKFISFSLSGFESKKNYLSALEDGRTYKINGYAVLPGFSLLLSNAIRLTTTYSTENRKNLGLYGGEKAELNSIIVDCRINSLGTGSLQVKGTYTKITYKENATATTNEAIKYAILESLSAGNNIIWDVNWSRKVTKGIEISLDYEGRKVGDAKIIHTGNMSLRAIL